MGMSIKAKLIYGVPYVDIPEELIEKVDELLDDGKLDYASPYYNSFREDWIVGKSVACWGEDYIDTSGWVMDEHIPVEFRDNGLECKFYVSPHVT